MNRNYFSSILIMGLIVLLSMQAQAEWNLVSEYRLAESEEPFSRRIYAYDLDLDSQGNPHLVYAQPVPGEDRTHIYYARRTGGAWTHTLLEEDGKHGSISTAIRVDKASNLVHVSYVRYPRDPETELVWQTIVDGDAGSKITVDAGGWHTRMELSTSGQPVFVRQGVTGLRFFTYSGGVWNESMMSITPGTAHYRIGDFKINREDGRYHIVYGDGEERHNLWYATSSDALEWQASQVDDSGTLVEFEFWTALALDASGEPHISVYKYAEYQGRYNTGTSLLFAKPSPADDGTWDKRIIAGAGPGAPPDHRAGMGAGMVFDSANRLHAFWDNSPDYPYDFDGARGNIVYHFMNAEGDWSDGQQVQPYSLEGYARLAIHENRLFLLALGDYIDAGLFIYEGTVPEVTEAWDAGFISLGGGWRSLSWFGDYVPVANDWYYHERHGFIWSSPGNQPESMFFYSPDYAWIWTSRSVYPYLYRYSPSAWLYYLSDSFNPRAFFNYATQEWEYYP